VVSGQWSVVSGQWSVVSGQLSVVVLLIAIKVTIDTEFVANSGDEEQVIKKIYKNLTNVLTCEKHNVIIQIITISQ
jgi:hypothetical protein